MPPTDSSPPALPARTEVAGAPHQTTSPVGAPKRPATRPADGAVGRETRRGGLLRRAGVIVASVAGAALIVSLVATHPAHRLSSPGSGALGTPHGAVTGHVALDDTLRQATGEVTWTWPAAAHTCDLELTAATNTPVSSRNGSHLWVDDVTVNGHRVSYRPTTPPGTAPGTAPDGSVLRTSHLKPCPGAGDDLRVTVRFRARAGSGGNERTGSHLGATWWGSLLPIPATPDPAGGWRHALEVTTKGEGETSQIFGVDHLAVSTPGWATLVGPGTVTRGPTSGGRATWRIDAPALRDLAVVAGHLTTLTRGPEGCQVTAAVPSVDGPTMARAVAVAALRDELALRRHFLFCPYPRVTVAAVQPGYGGMEFPGLVVVARHEPAMSPRLIAHELGHQYFYALVGSDQGRHPWLDEALATYAEALVNPSSAASLRTRTYPPGIAGHLGEPMTYWDAHPTWYSAGVYAQGATALLRARAGDPGRLDSALRDYLAVCSGRICGPTDLHEVLLAKDPAAAAALAAAGAWK